MGEHHLGQRDCTHLWPGGSEQPGFGPWDAWNPAHRLVAESCEPGGHRHTAIVSRHWQVLQSALICLVCSVACSVQQVLLNESLQTPPPPASLGVVGAQPLASCAPPCHPPLHPMSPAPTHPALPFPPVNFHNCICKVLSSHGAPFHAFVPLTPPYPQQLRDPSLCSVPNIFSLPCPTFPKEKFTKLIQHVGTHLPLITPHYFSTLVQPPSALHLASLTPLLPPSFPAPTLSSGTTVS